MSSRDLAFWTCTVESQIDLTPCGGCDSCGSRCASGVPLTRSEHQAVLDYIANAPDSEYIAAVTRQEKLLDMGDGIDFQMCRFRDMERGRCAVYPARPLMCRLMGHLEWMPCPIDKVPAATNTRDGLELMKSYSHTQRMPLETWFPADS